MDVNWDAIARPLIAKFPSIGTGLLIFVLLWLAAVIVRGIIQRVGRSRRVDEDVILILSRGVYLALLLCGIVSALGTFGVDVTALVASLGLTGFALGFALKDIISNALSGILLIIYQPIDRGDSIKVSSFEGTVTQINLRYTVLAGEQAQIFLPNSILFSNGIIVQQAAREATID